MKRFHVHVGVTDIDHSIAFYSSLFGARPSVVKGDYAKWMLEDPRINFAISMREDATKGVEHVGSRHVARLALLHAKVVHEIGFVHEHVGSGSRAS